jgi:hypothetical protein
VSPEREAQPVIDDESDFEEVSPLGRVMSLADLKALPRPQPMIEGVLGHRSAVLMVGATGSNKTFATVGLGLSVATGKPWLGHRVAVRGHVVFVIGEGAYGLGNRIQAWEEDQGVSVPHRRVSFVVQPDSITNESFWEDLTRHCLERRARLVILDTFSSLAPAADETKDAAPVMRRMVNLVSAIEGTALLVHHTGWGPQDRARGGSQFESNADEVIVLQKAGTDDDPNPVVTVKRKKVKEEQNGRVIQVRRKLIGPSAVLELVGEGAVKSDSMAATRDRVRRDILARLEADPYGYTKTDLRDEIGGKKDIFYEVWGELESTNWIVSKRERKEEETRSAVYWAPAPLEEMT